MEPLAFVIAILGCGDAGSACERVAVEPARYETLSACQAATSIALGNHTDVEFPVIQARCETRGYRIAAR